MILETEIVILCPHGRHRSRYLKEHLETLGYKTHALGVNHKSDNLRRKIKAARVIISVHPDVEARLREDHEVEGKRIVSLDVDDQPAAGSRAVTGEEWIAYQKEVVYPALEKSIKKHLPL